MRILVCEYVTGGGLAGGELGDLHHEAETMLRALVRDLHAAGADLLVSRDARLPAADLPGEKLVVDAAGAAWSTWARAMMDVDAVWPIAPETDGVLECLTALVLRAGKIVLGSTPEAVRLCGSKLATAAHLTAHGIPTVPTSPLGAAHPPESAACWVVKPDDGAGAENTFRTEARATVDACRAEGAVVQPYVEGDAVSLSLLCHNGECRLLSCNRQHVTIEEGKFRYHGWTVAGMEERRARYAPLAAAVARAIPGLFGYVGIDLIDARRGPLVLDINPRLTTPYAVLREAIGANPAAMVLALADGALPAHPDRRPQPIWLAA